jgi:hypothetical protein
MQRDQARRLLGVAPGASPAEVDRAFRRRARAAHPDHGGDADAFRKLVVARSLLTSVHRPPDGGYAAGAGTPRSRLVVRRTGARHVLRALRIRLRPTRPSRVH